MLQVLLKDKEAYGVEIIKDNKKFLIYANKEVILSSGSVNSPVLLMLSGIGPKEHLEKHGVCNVISFFKLTCHRKRYIAETQGM
jgi:choline dehydrogenase-like flavoprotein